MRQQLKASGQHGSRPPQSLIGQMRDIRRRRKATRASHKAQLKTLEKAASSLKKWEDRGQLLRTQEPPPLSSPQTKTPESTQRAREVLCGLHRAWGQAGVDKLPRQWCELAMIKGYTMRLVACAQAMLFPNKPFSNLGLANTLTTLLSGFPNHQTIFGRTLSRGELPLDVPLHPYESCAALSLWGNVRNRGLPIRDDDDNTIRTAVTRGLRAASAPRMKACCHVCCKLAPKRCARCRRVRYCSSECQRLDWQTHKLRCSSS